VEGAERLESRKTISKSLPANTGGMYASVVKASVPPMHATAIAWGEIQKQKVRLVQAAGIEVDGLAELTEKELVVKANVALDLMGLQAEDKPERTRFVGASKVKGGAMYEMNSEEAAVWLKQGNVMKAFVAKMGSTASYKVQTYEVMLDWVPVTFELHLTGSLESVEQVSGLNTAAILKAR
jgi:hypothetical protein